MMIRIALAASILATPALAADDCAAWVTDAVRPYAEARASGTPERVLMAGAASPHAKAAVQVVYGMSDVTFDVERVAAAALARCEAEGIAAILPPSQAPQWLKAQQAIDGEGCAADGAYARRVARSRADGVTLSQQRDAAPDPAQWELVLQVYEAPMIELAGIGDGIEARCIRAEG